MSQQSTPKPLILVTNDDGIASVGIASLVCELEAFADIIVVAPDGERSANGHCLSLTSPLRITSQEGQKRFAISGTPVDSVIMGVFHLCPRRPDLVISGINLGPNLGTDIFYSGTVAAALEGTIHGIPSFAVSQALPEEFLPENSSRQVGTGPLELTSPEKQSDILKGVLQNTAQFTAHLAKVFLTNTNLEALNQLTLNINAPAVKTKKFCWTRLGKRMYREKVEKRFDLRGKPYYWVGGPVLKNTNARDTDSFALDQGFFSLTLLGLDLTVIPSEKLLGCDFAPYLFAKDGS